MITGQDTKTGLLGRNTRTGYSRTGSQDKKTGAGYQGRVIGHVIRTDFQERIPGQGNQNKETRSGNQDMIPVQDTRTDNQDRVPGEVSRTGICTRIPGQVTRTR